LYTIRKKRGIPLFFLEKKSFFVIFVKVFILLPLDRCCFAGLRERRERFPVNSVLKSIVRICAGKGGGEGFWYEICFFFSEDNKQEEKK